MLTAVESNDGTTPGDITGTNNYAASDPDSDDSAVTVAWSLSGADIEQVRHQR